MAYIRKILTLQRHSDVGNFCMYIPNSTCPEHILKLHRDAGFSRSNIQTGPNSQARSDYSPTLHTIQRLLEAHLTIFLLSFSGMQIALSVG